MRYVSAEDALVLHAFVVDETGGSHGVRDVGMLQFALERARTAFGGNEVFSSVFEKAAATLESIARNHPFVDGNKRTALAVAIRTLELNGYEFEARNPDIVRFMVRVVAKHLEVPEIATWLKRHSRKT